MIRRSFLATVLVALGLRKADTSALSVNTINEYTAAAGVTLYGRAWVEDIEPLQREKNRILALGSPLSADDMKHKFPVPVRYVRIAVE